jgi:hypothetical protein
MWSFEMKLNSGEWQLSAKRAGTIEEAAEFAASWLVTCAWNNILCEVRLVQVIGKRILSATEK